MSNFIYLNSQNNSACLICIKRNISIKWVIINLENFVIHPSLCVCVFVNICVCVKQTNRLFFCLFVCLFYFTILYWLCHTLTWICHGCTCVPHPEPHSHLPTHPIPLGHPSAPAPSILYHALNLDWRFISHMILYMFQCHYPNHPTLALSHRVQKTAVYICVSFAVSHTGLSLPSF